MPKNYLKLGQSIAIDGIGALPTVLGLLGVPLTGALSFLSAEVFDLFWAPISGFLVHRMYKSSVLTGVNVVEEILPITDVIPTATIGWLIEEDIIKIGK